MKPRLRNIFEIKMLSEAHLEPSRTSTMKFFCEAFSGLTRARPNVAVSRNFIDFGLYCMNCKC